MASGTLLLLHVTVVDPTRYSSICTGISFGKDSYCKRTSTKKGRLLSCTVQPSASSCDPKKILDTTLGQSRLEEAVHLASSGHVWANSKQAILANLCTRYVLGRQFFAVIEGVRSSRDYTKSTHAREEREGREFVAQPNRLCRSAITRTNRERWRFVANRSYYSA